MILIIVIALAAAGGTALWFNQQPEYEGKRLSYWLARLDDPNDTAARTVVKDMGASIVPDLVGMLRSRDWRHGNRVLRWISRHEKLNAIVRVEPPAETRKCRALDAVECLGPEAAPALPAVLPLMTNASPAVRLRAIIAFAAIKPKTGAVPGTVLVLTDDILDKDWRIRDAALWALNALHPPPAETVPAAFSLTRDPVETVRRDAQICLAALTNKPPK